jgi:hypothetical protein
MYPRESILAIFVFPRHKNNNYEHIWCTVTMWKFWEFIAACRVGMMTLCECRVDCPFPYQVLGENQAPPPSAWALGRLFKPTFWRLTLSTPKRCHMDLWSARLVLTHHHHRHRLHSFLLHRHPESRVSNTFFLSVMLFLWRAAFCPFSVKQSAALQLSLFE